MQSTETLGPPSWLTNDVIFRASGRLNEKLQANCVRQFKVEVKPSDTPGKLGRLIRWVQSERPSKRRQSGAVECRRQPAPGGALATLARTGDVTNI